MASASATPNRVARDALRQRHQSVLVVSDHALTRVGLSVAMARTPNLDVCGEATSLEDALICVDKLDPDLMILDMSVRNGIGIGVIRECKERSPRLKILVLSMHDEWLYAGRALKAGALGYLTRFATPEMVAEAVVHVIAGQVYLSPELTKRMLCQTNSSGGVNSDPIATLTDREREVFELVGQGLTAQAIARRIKLSHHTVETYRERIKSKLDVKSGADLTFHAIVWVLMHE